MFIKGYGILSFAKNRGKKYVKTEAVNIAKNFLIMLNNLQQMQLKLFQEKQINKQQKQLII